MLGEPKLLVAAFAVLMGVAAPLAHADDTDTPPPYQIGQSSAIPGNQPFQSHCADVMISCGFLYDPGNGNWYQKGD